MSTLVLRCDLRVLGDANSIAGSLFTFHVVVFDRIRSRHQFLWYSVVITTGSTTGSTTGNYHRTSCGILGHYHRKVPHARYHRSTTGQYHRNTTGTTGTTGIPQEYHRNTTGQYHRITTGIPQVCGILDIPQEYHSSVPQEYHRSYHRNTTGQYHRITTGITTGLPQADTTGIPHSITTRIPHITTGIPHSNIPHGYHIALPCTVPRVATCSLVN